MDVALAQIVAWILGYRYAVLFPLAIVEGPIVSVIAGFACSLGYMSIPAATAIVVLADLIGDIALYSFGRFAGVRAAARWGRHVGVTRERLVAFEGQVARHRFRTLLAGKLLHGPGAIILAAAGLARLPFGVFMLEDVLITVPKSLALVLIGFAFGAQYGRVQSVLDSTALALYALVILIVITVFATRRFGAKLLPAADSTPRNP